MEIAGVEQPLNALADITDDDFDRIIAVDLRGVFLCMKYQIPLMLSQGGGAIVNTSSGAGLKGFKDQAAYAAAKHAVVGLTRSAALHYAADGVPDQRDLPRHHRHRDDGSLHRRHRRRPTTRHRPRTHRSHGHTGGDRRRGSSALLGRRFVRPRARHGRRRRPDQLSPR